MSWEEANPSFQQPAMGRRVLVTRPLNQAGSLVGLLEQQGAIAIRFPCIEILPPANANQFRLALQKLNSFDMAIFVSRNAVQSVVRAVNKWAIPKPEQFQIAAVGKATAMALSSEGWHPTILPEGQRANSEALLENPLMREVDGQNIVIFRGQSGRDLIRKTLVERGAQVRYVEAYRRRRPEVDQPVVDALFTSGNPQEIDIVTATSSEVIENLLVLVAPHLHDQLLRKPLVVISDRVADKARWLGFKQVISTPMVSDEAIVEMVITSLNT